jgi:hypothetical protein
MASSASDRIIDHSFVFHTASPRRALVEFWFDATRDGSTKQQILNGPSDPANLENL